MEFDPDDPNTQKIRDSSGNVHYIQNGHKFTAGLVDAGRTKKGKAQDVVVRAEKKVDSLKNFKEPPTTKGIAAALQENKAATAAEENA